MADALDQVVTIKGNKSTLDRLKNKLLNALSIDAQKRNFPQLKLVQPPLGKVIYEASENLVHVYFPTDSNVSLLYVMEDGSSAEISVIG